LSSTPLPSSRTQMCTWKARAPPMPPPPSLTLGMTVRQRHVEHRPHCGDLATEAQFAVRVDPRAIAACGALEIGRPLAGLDGEDAFGRLALGLESRHALPHAAEVRHREPRPAVPERQHVAHSAIERAAVDGAVV